MTGKRRAAALARAHHQIPVHNLGTLHGALKRRKLLHSNAMADVSMSSNTGGKNSQRDDGNQEDAFMIPGVDGRLQFGFPTKIITILRYVDIYNITSTTGGITTLVFRLNGCFDPDATNLGHQPMYYDNYAAIYDTYRVLGSRITAKISGANLANTQGPWAYGINGSTTSGALSTAVRTRMEQNDGISTMYNGQQTPDTLSFAYSPEIKLGRPAGDDTVGAAVGANPSAQYFAHVWFADLNGTTSQAVLNVMVEYTVEFYGLKQQSEN
uniref:Putative capsid protein n=1 Tax=Chrysolophus pictus CRESS-DNA-virus sp. TaxID=2815020 RepID=A0A8A4XBX6_9VIRU|nr:MAG: putative capsid protein [Chrysolophus pictus CRESS-DNA-virus sp.]